MAVYKILGQKAAAFINDKLPAGQRSAKLNTNNFAIGIYFAALRSGGDLQTIKVSWALLL